MLFSPIIFFYSFFIFLVFVIGVAPTAFWQRLGRQLSGMAARGRRNRLGDRLARAVKGADFTPDIDYLPAGIGLAIETARGRLFIAGERAGVPTEALLPLTSFRACTTGVITGGFSDDNYLDLIPADPATAGWRVSCGADESKAESIAARLAALGLERV
jgi:hypothetical protein